MKKDNNMPYTRDLAALITIRNFLMSADENVQCKLSKEESNGLRAKAIEIDRAIVDRAMKFDPNEAKKVIKVLEKSFTSSMDVDKMMEKIDNFKPAEASDNTDENGEEQPSEKPAKTKHKIVKHG